MYDIGKKAVVYMENVNKSMITQKSFHFSRIYDKIKLTMIWFSVNAEA